MPGHKPTSPRGKPGKSPATNPLRQATALAKAAAAPSPGLAKNPEQSQAKTSAPANSSTGSASAHSDESAITLSQFVKMAQLTTTGGQAKSLVRSGDILVNGEPEFRPGRKLHAGDIVHVNGEDYEITAEPE